MLNSLPFIENKTGELLVKLICHGEEARFEFLSKPSGLGWTTKSLCNNNWIKKCYKIAKQIIYDPGPGPRWLVPVPNIGPGPGPGTSINAIYIVFLLITSPSPVLGHGLGPSPGPNLVPVLCTGPGPVIFLVPVLVLVPSYLWSRPWFCLKCMVPSHSALLSIYLCLHSPNL